MAYQITVATTAADLEVPSAFVWDSGRVESDQSTLVPYAGPEVSSRQRVFWRVKVWDQEGHSASSDTAWWEMGLLEQPDWQAEWVAGSWFGGPRTTSPATYLRREFAIMQPVVQARLYATAIGVYECRLNGSRIGNDVLTPGWTDYNQRVQYQVYDVTSVVKEGSNALGSILGDGWAVGHIAWNGRQRYVDRPLFLAQLEIALADGSRQVIATDRSWAVNIGPILESDMLMGESYDARRELTGWDSAGYDGPDWSRAMIVGDNGALRVATNGPTIKRREVLQPISIEPCTGTATSRWVIDFGQNLVGWVRLKMNGRAGQTVSIRHAEILNPDGTIYTDNLRTASNIDHYTLKGGGEEVFEPYFTFHGFRYVELSSYPGEPTSDSIQAVVIHSDMPVTGNFECSDPLINQLQRNIVWGQKGNFIDVPTDCPQRDERLGWTGDAQVFVSTACFNMNVAGFFTKWMKDLEDAQSPAGAYPPFAPNPNLTPLAEGGPAWADAGIIIPWTIYQAYGDTKILEDSYESMAGFIDFLASTSRDGLRCYPGYKGWVGFGDWLALDGSPGREGGTSKELIGTAFYAYSSQLMIEIAGILGKEADTIRFGQLADEAKGAFQKAFVNADGTIDGSSQTAYVLALQFNLLPHAQREVAASELVRLIESNNDHLSTGFVGTPYITWVLSEAGHLSTAYDLLRQTSWPSWLYSVLNGGTTIWERWDGWTHDNGFQDPKMNSFNHYAYGAIGAWLYAVVGGIRIDPHNPGYKHVIMQPQPGGGLSHATIEYQSLFGLIRSAWKLENERFEWHISVPPNTSATVHLPVSADYHIHEGDGPAESANAVRLVKRDDKSAVYEVLAGDFHFTACSSLE